VYPDRQRYFLMACALVAEGEPVKSLQMQSPQQGGSQRRPGLPRR